MNLNLERSGASKNGNGNNGNGNGNGNVAKHNRIIYPSAPLIPWEQYKQKAVSSRSWVTI